MIKIDNLISSYPDGNIVIDNLSLSVSEGEKIGIIGANGAGKSTLLKSLLGLVSVEGDIVINGIKLCKKSLGEIRKQVGYLLQDSDNQMFMPRVIDDMIFGPMNYGLTKEEAEKKAEEALTKLNILHLKDKHNHKLSGGEKRMCALATILAMEPKIIMLDEPSNSLDLRNRRLLINTLNQIPITTIIATHDLDFVLETCNRVILINEGKIIKDGETLDILKDEKILIENGLELPFCFAGLPNRAI